MKKSSGKKLAATCTPCEAAEAHSGKLKRRGSKIAAIPCHPPGYVDPKVRSQLSAAERDMKRAGIKPKITSTWRSSKDQTWIYNCTSSKRCRATHPGLYKALPPGQSLHEAGFAVDVAGIASGQRGEKHLTPQGRKIVRIMDKHGFKWRYGLRDPVHFEADPKQHGYRSIKQAIQINQNRCEAKIAAQKASRTKAKRGSVGRSTHQRIAQSTARRTTRHRTA
ncbi:MAG TPA: D-alanyl-D-alanine carboxypeptidase family protein [Blastocatellia bacterium]|nr:D-alanyl-D-alanine carboxypeptidase family protein [Blastocatellia bacterium]